MKLVDLILGGVLVVAGLGAPAPALADSSRPPVEATAHALDELANCRAQRRPECPTETPTPEPTATWTPSPTATSTPQPTDTPTPTPVPVVVLEPCWATDPDTGDIVFDLDGAPVPCSLEQAVEVPIDTPEPTPAPTPTDRPTQAPRVAQPAAPAAAAPREVIVVQTVIVTVRPADTATPMPTVAQTPDSTRTATPTRAVSPTGTRTTGPTASATGTSTAVPVLAASERAGSEPLNVPWGLLVAVFAGIAAVFGACWIGIAIKRRTVVRKPRPPREDVYA